MSVGKWSRKDPSKIWRTFSFSSDHRSFRYWGRRPISSFVIDLENWLTIRVTVKPFEDKRMASSDIAR